MHGAPRASLRRPVTMEAPMPVRDQSPFGVAVLLIDSDDFSVSKKRLNFYTFSMKSHPSNYTMQFDLLRKFLDREVVGGIHTSLVAVEAYVTEDGGVGVGADNGRSLAVPVCDVYLRKGEIDILPRPLQEATATLPPTRLLLLLLAARRARHRGRRHRPWHHLVLPFLIDAIILRFLVRLFSFPFPLILLRHANATSSSASTPVHPTLGHAPRGAPLAGGDGVARPGALRPPRRWRLAALAEQPPGVARHQEVGAVHLGIALPAQARLTRNCHEDGANIVISHILGPRTNPGSRTWRSEGWARFPASDVAPLPPPAFSPGHVTAICPTAWHASSASRAHLPPPIIFFYYGKWGTSGDEGASGISLATIPIQSHAGSVDFGRPGHRITIRRRRAPDRRLRWPVTSVWAMKKM
ncbi:hypothetical protein BHM03_00000742 [Ensete ventricosum]|nr:hypothetical protein BHM03_00000742 [Ensete ventricosum]